MEKQSQRAVVLCAQELNATRAFMENWAASKEEERKRRALSSVADPPPPPPPPPSPRPTVAKASQTVSDSVDMPPPAAAPKKVNRAREVCFTVYE